MKIDSLRDAIATAFPDFATDPDRLCMWIEKGSWRSTGSDSRDFEYEYVANLTLESFAGHPSVLVVAINDWLRVNQRERVQPGAKETCRFETIPLDDGTIDLHVQVELTERVSVAGNPDSTDTLEHLDDSGFVLTDALLADDAPMLSGITLVRTPRP